MRVDPVEKLGDIVAFKPDSIQVVNSVYDKVEDKQDFIRILNIACDKYRKSVEACKAKGEKPNVSRIKKQSVDFIKDYLKSSGVSKDDIVIVRSSKPRIPDDNEVVKVSRRSDYNVDIDVDPAEMDRLFNNANSESFKEEAEEEESALSNEESDLLGEDTLGFDELDGLEDI